MTVLELIEQLKALPGDSRVVIPLLCVDGKDGYSEVSSVGDGYTLTPEAHRGMLRIPMANDSDLVACVLLS